MYGQGMYCGVWYAGYFRICALALTAKHKVTWWHRSFEMATPSITNKCAIITDSLGVKLSRQWVKKTFQTGVIKEE